MSNLKIFVLWLLFSCVLLGVYSPALRGGPIWDDEAHMTRVDLRGVHGLWLMWTKPGTSQQYYPMVDTAFWIQHKLWGDSTLGYHVVNVLLHAFVAVLIGTVLSRMSVPGAWLAAVIFALHPVHVESVAWISELKNVLSTTFYMLALVCYLRFRPAVPPPVVVKKPVVTSYKPKPVTAPATTATTTTSGGAAVSPATTATPVASTVAVDTEDETGPLTFYFMAFALFAAALLTKSVTASLPAAILLLTWWRRGRLSLNRDVLPLLPFFIVGVAMGLYTAWFEKTHVIGPSINEFNYSIAERFLIAGRVLWFYAGKLVWPTDLIFIYPRWTPNVHEWRQWLYPAAAGLFLLSLVLLLLLNRNWGRGPLTAALFFGGTLVPALGFIDVYPFRYSFVADHFQYLASLGVIGFFACAYGKLLQKAPGCAAAAIGHAPVVAVAVLLAVLSFQQSRMYSDVEALWKTTIEKNPKAMMAYQNLSLVHMNKGDLLQFQGLRSEATERYNQAIEVLFKAREINPADPDTYTNLSVVYNSMDNYYEALANADKAIELGDRKANAYLNKIVALKNLGRISEAIDTSYAALKIDPDNHKVYNGLGVLYALSNRYDEAFLQFQRAMETGPKDANGESVYLEALQNYAYARFDNGDFDESVRLYRRMVSINPKDPRVHLQLGNLLGDLNRTDEALEAWNEVIRLSPDSELAKIAQSNIEFVKIKREADKDSKQPPPEPVP